MDKKYQVVFLIDKSLERAKNFLNHRQDRLAQCDNNPEGEKQSPLNNCSSHLFTSLCDCETAEDSDQVRSRIWKSISLSALRILCYLFTKNLPGNSNKKNDESTKNLSAFSLNNDDYDNNNEENVCNKQTATNLENKIEYLKKRQSSLQWGYKFFTSNKLPGKTDHHQLKDFKLRYFEEFEKELKKQFEELNDDPVNTKTNPSRKDGRSSPTATERRKSNGPSPSECLKRTLSHVLYDFNWENPDITSPIISRKSSLSKKKRSSNSGHRGSDCSISSGPHNLVFLFQTCPSSKLELRHFAGKMVVDSEVLLDSFMPPSLFKEFVVNRNLSLYWIDHQIHDDIFLHHANVSDYENESFRIVNEALAKLGGTLIPLDSLTVAGSLHWSSIYYNTKWANHLFLDVNSPQQLSHFGNFLQKKSDVDDDFPSLPSNNKAVSKDQNKRSKHQIKGRGLLPVTSVLDHFIKGPCTTASALIKDGGNLTRQPHIEATLGFHQNETQPELCPLMLVPTNSSGTGTIEKFFSCSQLSSSGADVHVSMTDKHKQSKGDSQPNVQFILSSEPQSQSSSLMLSSQQSSICLQLEVYSYLRRSDVCSTSDYAFFCTVCIQRLSKFTANKKSDNPKSSTFNSYAKFQSLLLRLTEADQNLVLTVKLDGQSTPFLAVLQPLSVSLGLIVFFPMGLSLNLENHLVCKSNHNVTKETTPAHTSQLEADDLDYITQHFAKKLWHPKYIPQSFEMHRSDINVRNEVSKLNVFDSAVLNKWNLPCCNNPEMAKMSMSFDKNIATDREACVTRETNLFKQLKTFYRQADSPSQLVNKKQQQEEEKKLAENMSEETACQNAGGEPKPRILQKLRSFTLGPTRAEMILSKSMQVVEQQSKVDKDESIGMSQSSRLSLETESQALAVVKQIDDDLALSSFIKEFYESTITNNLNSWNRMHHMVAIVHMYMKERSKKNPEAEAKKFLEEQVYLSSFSLRQKYQDAALSTKKQNKILEYQLQIILRMEMLSYLKLSEDHATNEDEEQEDNEESIVDSFVDEIVTMLRTLSFITDAAIVPVFLNDVLLKNYTDTLMRPLAEIYNELLQPLPSVLAASADSPESSIPSSFCPSTVGTCILDETTRDGFPENGTTQAKRAKTIQVVPGLGEGVKRQIVVGKKPAATAKQNNPTKNAKNKKTEENDSKEKVRARRSLFMSEKRNLERHRSFALHDKDKTRSHQKQRHSHRFSSKHSMAKSSSAQKRSKTMVAETPAHKQISQVMRRWHLLQSRLTEPMQNTQPVCAEINTTPKRAKPDMTVSIIEESPLKEGISIPKLSENCKKTTVLIRRAFYGSQNEKSQSRNLTKYLELADRIAGRHDRYAQLTDLSTISQMNQNVQSPVDKPSSFALSQLMGSPSTSSPKSFDSTVLKYTPNRKSPSFPFSTSPKFTNKTSERISVKQALFRTPEKNVAKSQTLPSSNLSSQSPCSSTNQLSVRNKLALLNSPPNRSKCIFKTPTKEPICIFKSPDKTPTSKKLNTTPVKSYAQMLVRKSDRKRKLTDISSDEPQYSDSESRNLHSKALFKSEDLCSTNILIGSHQLPSKSSPNSDSLEATSGDNSIKFSSNSKLKKLTFNQDNNNNSTIDQSSMVPLHSSPLKLLPSASLSQCSGKKRLKTLQASWENKVSVVHQDKFSSLEPPKDKSKPKRKQKRKNLSEIVSEASSPLKSKRQRRSLSCTLHKHEDAKEDQANKISRNQPPRGKNLYANRTRRSTAIQRD